MTTQVNDIPPFIKALKQLARKFPQVVKQIEDLTRQIEQGERPGDALQDVGYESYKVRMANPSAGRGKSGGLRLILPTISEEQNEASDLSPDEDVP